MSRLDCEGCEWYLPLRGGETRGGRGYCLRYHPLLYSDTAGASVLVAQFTAGGAHLCCRQISAGARRALNGNKVQPVVGRDYWSVDGLLFETREEAEECSASILVHEQQRHVLQVRCIDSTERCTTFEKVADLGPAPPAE